MDSFLGTLYRLAAEDAKREGLTPSPLVLVALGGYGRGELHPLSDLDLMVIYDGELCPYVQRVTQDLLYALWDLGLQVGHAVRSLPDCVAMARTDFPSRTSMQEARFLVGDRRLFKRFRKVLRENVYQKDFGQFLETTLAERDQRYRKFGGSPYIGEPNVKESAGGLRDIHTAMWLASTKFGTRTLRELADKRLITAREQKSTDAALTFLWRVRNELHFLSGHKNDVLSRDIQPQIAKNFGYASDEISLRVEKFMRDYYLHARVIHRVSRRLIARCQETLSRRGSVQRRARQEALADGLIVLVQHEEPVGERLLAETALHRGGTRERLPAAGDEAPGHAVNHPRVEIVVPHELLHRQGDVVGHVAEVLRDLGLDVAREHVVLVAGQEVQLVAHSPEKGQRGVRGRPLAVGDEPLVGQLAQGARPELGGGQPHGGVDVPEASRRLLHVGLAHVGGAAELPVALVPLGQRGLQELGEVLPVDVLGQDLPEAVEEPPVADEIPRLLHGGPAGEVRPRHGHAVGQAPHRMAHLEPQVPQRVEEPLGRPLDIGPHLAIEDHHEVQVGQRMELAATIPAQRHQDHEGGGEALPARVLRRQAIEGGEEGVHEGGIRLDGLLAGGASQVGSAEKVHVGGEVLAEQLEAEPAPALRAFRRLTFEALLGLGLDAAELLEQLG